MLRWIVIVYCSVNADMLMQSISRCSHSHLFTVVLLQSLIPLHFVREQVVKLNDTNNWRQRHALVVPHTFLYYFGSDSPTELSPHGVIDLEQYTDVKVLDGERITQVCPIWRNMTVHF